MAYVARSRPRLRGAIGAHAALAAAGVCLALAALSLLLPWRPTYDPWAWLVFGRELVTPSIGFSTLAHTGWKPLPVLFTAPFGLLGGAQPFLWLLLVRASGFAAIGLAFRLAWRAAGVAAGVIAALALIFSADWLRYLSAGNIEPFAVALLLGGVELHLIGRRGWAFALGTLAGLARPEIWPLLGIYALYLWWSERRRWPLLVGLPAMVLLWVIPDWAGSGELFHTFHSATISGEPTQIMHSSHPALTLTGRALGILVAPVWIGALAGLVWGWQQRDRTVLAVAAVGLSWTVVTIGGEAVGYPAVPRYLVEAAAMFCVLAGVGMVAMVRASSDPRVRVALAALLIAVSVPFAVARSIGLRDQARGADARAADLASLFRAVDRAGPLARQHPLISPGFNAPGAAWKLRLRIFGVSERPGRQIGVAFVKGQPPQLAALQRMGATLTPVASDGQWRALRVSFPQGS
ncbi:MAG: hypothetical protein ACXVRH_13585 [Thermoleophilaceae bacterium]